MVEEPEGGISAASSRTPCPFAIGRCWFHVATMCMVGFTIPLYHYHFTLLFNGRRRTHLLATKRDMPFGQPDEGIYVESVRNMVSSSLPIICTPLWLSLKCKLYIHIVSRDADWPGIYPVSRLTWPWPQYQGGDVVMWMAQIGLTLTTSCGVNQQLKTSHFNFKDSHFNSEAIGDGWSCWLLAVETAARH